TRGRGAGAATRARERLERPPGHGGPGTDGPHRRRRTRAARSRREPPRPVGPRHHARPARGPHDRRPRGERRRARCPPRRNAPVPRPRPAHQPMTSHAAYYDEDRPTWRPVATRPSRRLSSRRTRATSLPCRASLAFIIATRRQHDRRNGFFATTGSVFRAAGHLAEKRGRLGRTV